MKIPTIHGYIDRRIPKGLPDFVGVNSENGAHRIAVEWDENEELFPKDSVTFDNSLLMTGIEHEWESETDK